MKKSVMKTMTILILAVMATMVLFGCGKKKTITAQVEGLGDYQVVELPADTVNSSFTDDSITFTVDKEGDYSFVLEDEKGEDHTVTVKYHDNSVEPEYDDDAITSVNLSCK